MTIARHIAAFLMGWVGAAAAATMALTLVGVLGSIYADAVCDAACRASRTALGMPAETIASKLLLLAGSIFVLPFALFVTLPVMVAAYPIAVIVARRLRSRRRTAVVGAIAALILVLPIGAADMAINVSPDQRQWLPQRIAEATMVWGPAIAAAGATLGWIVAGCLEAAAGITAVRTEDVEDER